MKDEMLDRLIALIARKMYAASGERMPVVAQHNINRVLGVRNA